MHFLTSKLLVSFLVLMCSSWWLEASERDLTPDGRFDTRCLSSDRAGEELCRVSFYKLIAVPEKYHGRLIAVVGYLRTSFGRPVLFVNRDSFESNADYEGVAITDGDIPKEIKEKMDVGVWPVLVVGVFDARYAGIQNQRLGALRKVRNVAMMDFPVQ